MSPAAATEKQLAPPQCVQEIVINSGHEIPKGYLNNLENVDGSTSVPLMDAPAIDMGLLASRSPDELAKFRSILTSWGCFQVSISIYDLQSS